MQTLAALHAAVFPLSAKNLRGGVKPPPGPARVKTTWVYCPGHAGIDLNEVADRLTSRENAAMCRISLSALDIEQLLIQKHREAQEMIESRGSAEVERMAARGLERGWVRRSRRFGATGRLACQLACGTISGGRWMTSARREMRRRHGRDASGPARRRSCRRRSKVK